MHAGHICLSSELLVRPRLSGARRFRSTPHLLGQVRRPRFCIPPAPDQTTEPNVISLYPCLDNLRPPARPSRWDNLSNGPRAPFLLRSALSHFASACAVRAIRNTPVPRPYQLALAVRLRFVPGPVWCLANRFRGPTSSLETRTGLLDRIVDFLGPNGAMMAQASGQVRSFAESVNKRLTDFG
jgi:hypothetical protein